MPKVVVEFINNHFFAVIRKQIKRVLQDKNVNCTIKTNTMHLTKAELLKEEKIINLIHHDIDITTKSSTPFLGATLDKKGCHFSVISLGAVSIELCLFDAQENETTRYKLHVKNGRHWSVFVEGIKAGQLYGYRVDGEYAPEKGLLFNKNNLLIDPYAKGLNRVQDSFDQSQTDSCHKMIAKSVVIDSTEFDWGETKKPSIAETQRILYEVHVKGFSQLNKKVAHAKRGKYLGLSDATSIAHYKKLGITSLQIMPIFSFMSEPRLDDLKLTNYWGYNPINLFSPDNRYAKDDAVKEFKQMVKELHANDIEVILDVVYNHTAEGGFGGPSISFRGLDNRNYYTFEKHPNTNEKNFTCYSNHSGCGNSLDNHTPWMLKLTMDSLRYWVTEMQVDGFRFDLAVTLGREELGFTERSAFLKAVYQDPILNDVVLIAEPWDIGPGGYRVGGFPTNWFECNDKYRDCMRSFWRGDTGKIGEVATRVLGSRDLFAEHFRTNSTSVNYICYHDGFTLEDLVSYENRHNYANEEGNRDGHGNNLSANFGIEGKTSNIKIKALREKQKRNLIATLLLSQGTPHLLAGDEMGNTQSGNNNAYCQDNELSWLSWDIREKDQAFIDFTGNLTKLRSESVLFTDIFLKGECLGSCEKTDSATWYHPNGHQMEDADWHDHGSLAVAVDLLSVVSKERWFLILNASTYNIACSVPKLPETEQWEVMVNTIATNGQLVLTENERVDANIASTSRSVILLKRVGKEVPLKVETPLLINI